MSLLVRVRRVLAYVLAVLLFAACGCAGYTTSPQRWMAGVARTAEIVLHTAVAAAALVGAALVVAYRPWRPRGQRGGEGVR